MRHIRNLTLALVFAAVISVRRGLSRVDNFDYVGRHRCERGQLTTMEETAISARAQQAGSVALDIHDRATEVLPQREPGKAKADLEAEWLQLRDQLIAEGIVLRPARYDLVGSAT